MSRGPIRNQLEIGMGGHIRPLYMIPEVNGGLYMTPEVGGCLGGGTYFKHFGAYFGTILACGGHLWCRVKGYSPAVPFMY